MRVSDCTKCIVLPLTARRTRRRNPAVPFPGFQPPTRPTCRTCQTRWTSATIRRICAEEKSFPDSIFVFDTSWRTRTLPTNNATSISDLRGGVQELLPRLTRRMGENNNSYKCYLFQLFVLIVAIKILII